MRNKLIITESQLARLKAYLTENSVSSIMVEKMKKELDSNYEISSNYSRKGGEYQNVPMIKVKVDGELITPKDLFDYLQSKYKSGDAFIKQVIKDWVDGTISDDYQLSKNVALK